MGQQAATNIKITKYWDIFVDILGSLCEKTSFFWIIIHGEPSVYVYFSLNHFG